jgi:hypothetical protein
MKKKEATTSQRVFVPRESPLAPCCPRCVPLHWAMDRSIHPHPSDRRESLSHHLSSAPKFAPLWHVLFLVESLQPMNHSSGSISTKNSTCVTQFLTNPWMGSWATHYQSTGPKRRTTTVQVGWPTIFPSFPLISDGKPRWNHQPAKPYSM